MIADNHLLQSRTGRNDAVGAETLAEALGRLPLALDHAAAYCKRTQMQFGDYAKKVSSLIAAAPRGAGYPRSVAATFDLAIGEAVAQCQAAEALIAYLAQCAPERIPMPLVEGAVGDEAKCLQALAALAEVSLVKHDPFEDGTQAVTVHRLVQAVALARSEAKGSAQDARGRLIARLVAIYPEDEHSNDPNLWPLCSQLTPHLIALREARSDAALDITDWANLLARAFTYLFSRAVYSQAMAVVRNVLAICEKVLGPEHPSTAESLNNLACVLRAQGDLARARPLHERALAVREKVLGPEHPSTAESLNNLAGVLEAQGDLARVVRPLRERALAICEKALGPEHPRTASSLDTLGGVLQAQGDLARARPLHERALAIRKKALGPEHPNTALSLNNLATLLQRQGDLAGARLLFERALAIREKALGPEHPHTAEGLHSLALLLKDQGDLAGARPLFERALAICEKALGPQHPDTAARLDSLALLLRDQGDLAGARPLHERALAVREKASGPEHPSTALSLNNLATLLQRQGDFAGARPLFERALAITEKALGPEHPNTNRVRSNLCRLLLSSGQPTQALALSQTALAAHDKHLGRNHAWTKDSARVTADALDALGHTDEAKALREQYGVTPPLSTPQSS